MKWLILIIAVLIASVLLGQQALEDPGYVMVAYQGWKIETTVSLLVVALAVTAVLGYYVVRLLAGLWSTPGRIGRWSRRKSEQKAEATLNKGMVALFEGDWKQAEKLLTKKSKPSHTPLLNYLGAAKAAQEMGKLDQRDRYLTKAIQSDNSAEVAVGLTQARLQLEQGQNEQALASLERLRQLSPKHAYVLALLAETYRKLNEWNKLEDLLPILKKGDVCSEEELMQLNLLCYRNLIKIYRRDDDYSVLHQLWRRMPRQMHQEPEIVEYYVKALIEKSKHDEAEAILRTSLSQTWQPQLVTLYGMAEASNGNSQLAHAERWLNQHEGDAHLLLALGRICKRNELWGKARDYLEAAVNSDVVEVYQELTSLLEQMGEQGEAQQYYKQALKVVVEQ